MRPYELNWVRLPLKGAHNVRELGGYPAARGTQTAYHRFLRSDDPSQLRPEDVDFLLGYGLSAIIDLRDEGESESTPDVAMPAEVAFANIPLLHLDRLDMATMKRYQKDGTSRLAALYRQMLYNFEAIGDCMRFIASAPQGCVLFHCAVGKDRTGILSMLLLSLAGVSRHDIVSNYIQSWSNLMRDETFASGWADIRRREYQDYMRSDAETMEYALDLVEREFGDVWGYLEACGVTDAELERIAGRLI